MYGLRNLKSDQSNIDTDTENTLNQLKEKLNNAVNSKESTIKSFIKFCTNFKTKK